MCTVSIVPDEHGFRLMSNRDERRDRATALLPQIQRFGLRAAILPIDPVGGGSWIGVNDAGLVAAVLNRHSPQPPGAPPTSSRGLLVRHALACDSLDTAQTAMRALDPGAFQPFRLVLVQNRRIALVAGDGRALVSAESTCEQPYMFTASSLGDAFVDSPRRRLFECLMGHSGDWQQGQRAFHRHQWTDKREISVLMEREDAVTVSRTVVEVAKGSVALEYETLSPSQSTQRLELRPC